MTVSARHIAFVFFVFHLVVASKIAMFDDEAYYTLWARDLAWGYYDHPPMIAYMIRAGTSMFGETSFGVRFVGVVGMGVASLLVGDITRLLRGNAAQASLVIVLFNFSILVMGVGSFATPDAPSTVFWIAALWASIHAVQSGHGRWWIGAGVLIGLGGLSKFTNVFFAFGMLGWLICTTNGRRMLGTWRPYAAIGCAVGVLVPYLVWNIQTDWLGFDRQGSRLAVTGLQPQFILEYVVVFVLLPTPLVTWFALKAIRMRVPNIGLLLWSIGPVLIYFLFHASHSQVQANWLTPVQGPIAILAALALGGWSVKARGTVGMAVVMTCGLLGAAFNPWHPIGTADNPPNQTRGWDAAHADIQAEIEATGATWIATTSYATTGMLAYQFQNLPVWSVDELQRYGFKGDFPDQLCEATGLLVERTKIAPDLAIGLFEAIGEISTVRRMQGETELQSYRLRQVKGPHLCGD